MIAKNLLALFFGAITTFGFLSPAAHTFHKVPGKALAKKVAAFIKELDLNEADNYLQSPEFKKHPEHVRITQQSEVAFLKTLNEVNLVSYLAEQHLSYMLFEALETPVVTLTALTSSGNESDLARIARQENAAFVLHISRFDLTHEAGKSYADLDVQLFDAHTGDVILERTFTGNDGNPGFEYACEDGSVDCCINNALSKMVPLAGKLILSNDPGIQKQKQLAQEQAAILSTLMKQAFDVKMLKDMIPAGDKTIAQGTAYQLLFNADRTKFVAFFAEPVPAAEGQAFRDSHKGDHNVNIVSDDEMGFFSGKLPNTYAHIVRGVFHDGKWYYEKSDVTYFDAESPEDGKTTYFGYLRKWGFFKEGTAVLDPAFWEGAETKGYTLTTKVMFAKVPQDDEKHAGMYRIVADQLEK
jgi:hypothetical protein